MATRSRSSASTSSCLSLVPSVSPQALGLVSKSQTHVRCLVMLRHVQLRHVNVLPSEHFPGRYSMMDVMVAGLS